MIIESRRLMRSKDDCFTAEQRRDPSLCQTERVKVVPVRAFSKAIPRVVFFGEDVFFIIYLFFWYLKREKQKALDLFNKLKRNDIKMNQN